MAKPAPERLRLATYPWSHTLDPRFGDMDALRHLNNVAIARLYEDGRMRFTEGAGARAALEPDHGFLVAEVCIQYLAEGHYPDPLMIGCGVGRIGGSSFVVAQGLFQRGRCIGAADTTLVHVRRREPGSCPLPDPMRTALFAQLIRTPPQAAGADAPSRQEDPHA